MFVCASLRYHGPRRRISAEFEQRNLSTRVVAEIDSLSLLMTCVRDGMGVTIKPMSAALLEGMMRQDGRTLGLSDADLKRPNYLFSVVADRLTPAAAALLFQPIPRRRSPPDFRFRLLPASSLG